MTMARRCDAAGARSCQRLCRCAAGVLLALAATVAPGCAVEHSPASPCPPGHNRRTSTLSGGMPLDESSGLPSEGMLDGARALFRQPAGLAFSPDGAQVAVADAGNHQIRVVSAATGNVTTVAGAGPGFADGGDGLFNGPLGLAFSRDGTLLAVADVHNFRIRFLENPLCTPRGVSRTVAGGSAAGTADGTGTNAQFREPAGVAFSPDGRWLVVADKGSNVVRMVSVSSGVTTTLAGDPSESGLADGAAGQARFNRPCGVAFSPDGQTVAVADAVNHAVRVIRFLAAADAPVNVTVQTLAGGRNAGFADGLLSSFSDPHGVSFSPDGSLVAVADTGNHAIRIVNVTSGTTTTIGDRAPFSAQTVTDRFGDGAVPTFYRPTGVAFSPDGRRIAVADKGNNAIRTVNLGCIECAAATYKGAPGPADCAQCPSNSTSLAGSQSLADCLCRQGFEMVNGTCLACRAGYFNSVQGSTACTSCPASTYSDATAAVSLQACSPCPQHAFSDAGSNSKTMCLCEAGFSGSPGQDINCSACSQGFYKGANGTASCEPCEAGKYSNTTGASFCADCNAGSYSEILGALSCWPCPAGSFANSSSKNCTECGVGKYSNTTGASMCSDCAPGSYSDIPRALSCWPCPAGSFANSSSKNCTECGVGKYSNITGASLCSDCAPGSYSDIPRALSCWPCPAGSFANSSSKNCTECGVGKYSNITGASLCSDCAPGSYSDIPRALSCWPCPAGKYSQPAAATVCAECPVDAFATEGSSECLCNVGYSRSNLSLCAACAPGKYKAVNGSTCLLCPRAQYSSANASSACSLCPPFSTSREGSFDLSDCECNPGYTNAPQDLQSSVNASQDLRPRNMSAESSNSSFINGSTASACNFSSACDTTISANETTEANDVTTIEGQLQCRPCAAGTFKPTTGSSGCTLCRAGFYASNASAACISCPPFSFAPAGSVSRTDCKCETWYEGPPGGPCYLPLCPAGQYNRLFGLDPEPSALECAQCPIDSWSVSTRFGRESCVCNAGYSGADGGPCRACDLGEYKAAPGSSHCTLCKANSYTEKDSAAVSCLSCPNNSYSFDGSSGPLSCACNEGYSGPRCVVYSPQNLIQRGECAPAASFRKFEMELKLTLEASSDSELIKLKAKSAKEIANYFGPNSTVPVEVDPGSSASATRRQAYALRLKNQVEGVQEKFAESAAGQASALTAFLQLRGVTSARVAEINVKCGAGNTLLTSFATPFTSKPASSCAACPVGKYKQLLDNSQCVVCPGATTTKEPGATSESACTKWAGQQLTRGVAENAGYALSAIVASILGVNAVGLILNTVGWLASSHALETSVSLYASGDFTRLHTTGVLPGGSPNGCGGGGATMALITQVQFLQLMARIGGSQAQTGLAYFANSLGWFNLEFEKASFFGGSRDPHLMVYSALNVIPRTFEGHKSSGCSLEALIPTLDRLIWCVIILAAAALMRALLAAVVTMYLKKDLPSSLQFPSWEGPVLVIEYLAICSSAFLAVNSSCQQWRVVGYVIFVFWPLLLMVFCAMMLSRIVLSNYSTYASFDAKEEPPRLRPSLAEMCRSLDGRKGGFVPNFMRMREWFLAADARGWWRDDGSKSSSAFRFLIGDYVGHAWFWGIWLMAKRIVLSAVIVAVDSRASAIVCIVVQTFDMLFVIGLRPFVSKITCMCECISAVTNWLAFLNLGLLLWPGTIPLQLGEATVFGLAIMGTCLAALAAGLETLMAMVIVIWNLVAGFGVCLGCTGACMMAVRSTLQKCCFGVVPAEPGQAEYGGPILLTNIASDWAETPRSQSRATDDVTQNMMWAPVTPSGLPADAPPSSDPAVLAAYYRQLADSYQMMSMSTKKASNGKANPSPTFKSPVSMSTAPSAMYNNEATGMASSTLSTSQLPSFTDPQGLRSSALKVPFEKSTESPVSISASLETLLRLPQESLDRSIFSRRAHPSAELGEITNGVPRGSIPPPLGGSSTKDAANTFSGAGNTAGLASVNKNRLPMQSLSQRLASIPQASVSDVASRRAVDVAPSAWSLSPLKGDKDLALGAKRATARSLPQGSPRLFNNRDKPDPDSSPSRQVASTTRADQPRIRRRAEALERDLSPSNMSLSPSSITNSPVYARPSQMQVTPTRTWSDPDDDSRVRGMPTYGSPYAGSTVSSAFTPAGLLLDPDNMLVHDMAGLRHPLLDAAPLSLPPPPTYPAPPPPPVAGAAERDGSDDWETGFG